MALKEIDKKILKTFGDKVLRANVTSMITYLIREYDQSSPVTIDDVSEADVYCPECGRECFSKIPVSEIDIQYADGYVCPVCKEVYADRIAAQRCCLDSGEVIVCESCGEVYLDENELYRCVEDVDEYEWWIVEPWAWRDLDLYGEVMIKTDEYNIWGRNLNQKDAADEPYLDGAIINLAHEKGILSGEKNSWAALLGG